MKIVLATGIYPPDIGGPATYSHQLASELQKRGEDVTVITYGEVDIEQRKVIDNENWIVECVPRFGGPITRWLRYAAVLKKCANDADFVIAFSSVSCGVPLKLARLKKPKKILRLGGDFFWERYTDNGGECGLRIWYDKKFKSLKYFLIRAFYKSVLKAFNHIIFSTRFQEEIYENNFKYLPSHSVIENALPSGALELHKKHDPFRILFMGRLVGFKNLPELLAAASILRASGRDIELLFVGDGPMKKELQCVSIEQNVEDITEFKFPVHGEDKKKTFVEADLLVIPSITEISPNVALEARAAGLPVLLSKETGLSDSLTEGMVISDLIYAETISHEIEKIIDNYDQIASDSSKDTSDRGWDRVAEDWLKLCSKEYNSTL
ncbi:glycosyltransferase family 4 protein [Candidatus Peribacteria bacterium]|jgi:glycosyltransferase involved in cell wall biosynthesis|nr:glycosyltransferase family 4 protein [Candidatus Peribacteria bacterium]MBT4021165.1 glycosyltransferase family 4 protein [Candidatus Peribacteria bacterium]MBT4240941.1 glycosyltransferase family 4 protein [Candidatus Peribacteria bacterium]MBT4474584.1 glycosyltransferase family 4 protein [Candidatus Peribacteria bacterium]